MTDGLTGILNRVSNPADMATVLIAGATGFVVDSGADAVTFLEPGAVGIVAAAVALGVKLLFWQSAFGRLLRRSGRRPEAVRAKRLLDFLAADWPPGDKYRQIAARLNDDLHLFHMGVISETQFSAAIDEAVADIRHGVVSQASDAIVEH